MVGALYRALMFNFSMSTMKNETAADEKLLDERALKARGITYSRYHKKRLEDAGKFPKRIRFGNRSFWLKSEIDAWIADRIAERDDDAA